MLVECFLGIFVTISKSMKGHNLHTQILVISQLNQFKTTPNLLQNEGRCLKVYIHSFCVPMNPLIKVLHLNCLALPVLIKLTSLTYYIMRKYFKYTH